MTHWSLNPVINGYVLVLLVLVLAGVALLPTFRSMQRWQRVTLTGLRLAVILLALVLMLRPTRVSTSERPVSARLVVLFDQSRSMQVPDMPDGKTRWDAQREMLAEAYAVLRQMPDNIEVKVYSFDERAQVAEPTEGALVLPTVPEGRITDHGSSLDDILRDARGRRLAAVILSGDGAQRAYATRVEMQQAAREIARLGAPLYTVPFGKDIEKSQARDVAVENLRDHYTVFVKNELVIHASLRVRGFVNQPIPVQLVVEDAQGKETVFGPLEMKADKDGQLVDLHFNFTPQATGQYRLILRADEQAGELVTKNNQQTAFLTVIDGGLKVLYLEGDLRHEYTFLRRSLGSSPDIQLEDVWIDDRQRDRWPLDFAKQFSDPQYDVFILGSVDAKAFSEASLKALEEAVDKGSPHGKGLLVLGGPHSYGPGGYASTPLKNVLPVEMEDNERQDFDAPLRADRHHPGPLQMMPAQGHYVTNLAPEGENQSLWQSLKPLKGANRFDRLRGNPTILAQTPSDIPLLVAARYGDGRVLAFAGDSTYQWAMQGARDVHIRFWRNTILWLAQKTVEEGQEVWIDLPQRRFSPGSRVDFRAGARSKSDGRPLRDAELIAQVTLPDGSKKPARLVPEGDQQLGLFKETPLPGQYTIEVALNKAGVKVDDAVAKFVVLDQDIELGNPSANPDGLDALASITKDSGGRLVPREELVPLLEQIKNSPPQLREEVQNRWELGKTGATAWLFLLLIVGLLTGEWYLRKRWGLV